jgi:hypothetical protein
MRRRRRWKRYVAAFALGAAVLAVAIWSALPALVERDLRQRLRDAGFAAVDLNVAAVGLSEARIDGVRLGADAEVSAAEITATYDLDGVLNGRLTGVAVSGLRLVGRLDSGGLSLGGLEAKQESGGGPLLDPAWLRGIPPVSIDDGRIDLATPAGPVAVQVEGTVSPQPGDRLRAALALQLRSAQATARGDLEAALAAESLAAELELAEAEVAGVAFSGGALAIAVTATEWSAQLRLPGAGQPSEMRASLEIADPLTRPRLTAFAEIHAAAGAWVWPALGLPQPQAGTARVKIELAGPLPDGPPADASPAASATLGLLAGSTLDGTAEIEIGNLVLPGIATIAAATGSAGIGVADGTVTMAPTLTLNGLSLPGLGSGRFEVAGTIAGEIDRLDGRLHAVGSFADLGIGGMKAGSLDVEVESAVGFAASRLSLRLVEEGSAVVHELSGAPLAGTLKELAVPLPPSEDALIAVDMSAAAPRLTYDLKLGALKAAVPLLVGGPKPLPVAVTLPETRCAGSWSGDAGHRGTVNAAGSLAFSSLGATAKGVEADIAFAPERSSAAVRAAAIALSGKPPPLVPLALTGTAELIGERLSFTADLGDKSGHLKLSLAGEHDLAAATGTARLQMPPLAFAPGKLQPRDIAPAIAAAVEDATGEAALGGSIGWTAGKLSSDLKILLQDLSFRSPQADVQRLNGVVEIDGLVPLTTPPGQQLSAALVDVGLPLGDVLAAFRIEPGPRLVVENARLSLADGAVTMPPVAVDLAQPDAEMALAVDHVDLARLLELAQIEGLSATGDLGGRIPVRIGAGGLVIRDAVLVAAGPGTLRYAPAATPSALLGGGESVELALQALSNFQYSDLKLTVNRAAGGDTVALMQVKGRNPDFYGGHPVEFNLNISGKLDQILDRGLAGYRIPDAIREKLGEFAE